MKRRKFLKGAAATGAATAAVAASNFPAPAISQGMRELKMVTSFPKNFPGLGTSANRVVKRIEEASDGKIKVKLFNAGELVAAFEVFDAVAKGDADMYFSAEYYFPGKSKAFNFFTAVPYGMTGPETAAWIHYGGGQQLWDEISGSFGLKPFIAATTGTQMGGWLNKEINSLDDFKGLKFRMPGLGGEVLRALGAAVVGLPGGEIFQALQSGAIDGTEWVGPWHDLNFGFYKVTKYYYWPGFHEPGTTASYAVNKKLWEGLASWERSVIEHVFQAEAHLQSPEYDAASSSSLHKLVNEHGVQLRRYSNDLLNELGKVSGEVVAEIGNTDANTKKVWESYRSFRKDAIGWTKIGVQAFVDARALPFKYG
jgi:TRAP-type mannitol/chloroaromatic compound transport system substrate-binding protein